MPVTNDWTITDNYWDEQTSLNSAQATPDTEGGDTYTIVVSKNDPGMDKWVSTGGLNHGTLSIRFQGVDPNGVQPTVTVEKIVIPT